VIETEAVVLSQSDPIYSNHFSLRLCALA